MPRGAPRLRTQDDKINLVGDRVYLTRTSLKLTQDVLCAKLAVVTDGAWIADRRDIWRIEQGLRIVSDLELIALAKALDCWENEGHYPNV
jgi:transcriptional regulator with XRE-family HTH domain